MYKTFHYTDTNTCDKTKDVMIQPYNVGARMGPEEQGVVFLKTMSPQDNKMHTTDSSYVGLPNLY